MGRRIVVLQGHPDPAGGHYCHALADAYAGAATDAGHEVHRIAVAELDFPWLRNKHEFESEPPPPVIVAAQQSILHAEHLLIVYPLWLGAMPAQFKAFLEQTLREGFAFEIGPRGPAGRLRGRSARIVVTMGMPALFYRLYFGAHGVKALERSILGFCGIRPIRNSLIGNVESPDGALRGRWLEKMEALGRAGD